MHGACIERAQSVHCHQKGWGGDKCDIVVELVVGVVVGVLSTFYKLIVT